MKKAILTSVLVLFTQITFAGPDFNLIARRAERSSWENAKAWAHYLAVQDLLAAMSKVYFEVASSTIDEAELNVLMQQNSQLAALYDQVATEQGFTNDELKNYVFEELSKYALNLKKQFHVSWNPTIQAHAFNKLNEILGKTLSRYEQTCEVGRTSSMADTEVPPLRIPSISTNVTLSPSLENQNLSISFSAVLSGGDPNSDWQQDKSGMKMYSHGVVGLASFSGALAGSTAGISLIIEMAFLIVDHFITSNEVRKMRDRQARAMDGYYKRRARNRDIIDLYKENCLLLSSGFKQYVEIVNSKDAKRTQAIEKANSEKFKINYRNWIDKQQKVDQAACRANLLQNHKNETCPAYNVKPRDSKFIVQPACAKAYENVGGSMLNKTTSSDVCPKIEVPEENNCRIDVDGTTLRLLTEPSENSTCRVNFSTYECSAEHLEDLKLAGREIELIECETREERAEAERQRLQSAWQKTYDKCMESSQSDGSQTAKAHKFKCQNEAKNAKERAKIKTGLELEQEEIKQFEVNDQERAKQVVKLKEKMLVVADMLGHITVLAMDEQSKNMDTLKDSERRLEGKRKAARERLLILIKIVQNSFDSSIVIEEQAVSKKWFQLQGRFSLLGAQAINNLMVGMPNDQVISELYTLLDEFDQLTADYPALAIIAFSESVEDVIRVVR